MNKLNMLNFRQKQNLLTLRLKGEMKNITTSLQGSFINTLLTCEESEKATKELNKWLSLPCSNEKQREIGYYFNPINKVIYPCMIRQRSNHYMGITILSKECEDTTYYVPYNNVIL